MRTWKVHFPVSSDNKHLTGRSTSSSHRQHIKIVSCTFTSISLQPPISGFIVFAIALSLCMYTCFYATVSPFSPSVNNFSAPFVTGTHAKGACWISREASRSARKIRSKTPDWLSWDASLKDVEAICCIMERLHVRASERENEREGGEDGLQGVHFLRPFSGNKVQTRSRKSYPRSLYHAHEFCIRNGPDFEHCRKRTESSWEERRLAFVFIAQCDRPNFLITSPHPDIRRVKFETK